MNWCGSDEKENADLLAVKGMCVRRSARGKLCERKMPNAMLKEPVGCEDEIVSPTSRGSNGNHRACGRVTAGAKGGHEFRPTRTKNRLARRFCSRNLLVAVQVEPRYRAHC